MSVSAHTNLQKMEDQTGGEYYYSSSGNELSKVILKIEGSTVNKIDSTDDDEDGLYDIYERTGMRLPNGQVVCTDPCSKDTDGDQLSDFQEIGIVFNVDNRYIGKNVSKQVKYFVANSDPTAKDTDGDGIMDKDDAFPWIVDSVTANLGSKFGLPYLNVEGPTGNSYNGGHQSWWATENPRFDVKGCGVIAANDLELYLAQQKGYTLVSGLDFNDYGDYGYTGVTTAPSFDLKTGQISYVDYKNYVEYNEHERYSISGILPGWFGLLPDTMKAGLFKFMKLNNMPYNFIQYGEYFPRTKKQHQEDIINNVERMVSDDLPIIFSYDNAFAEDGHNIQMYSSLERAKNHIFDINYDRKAGSHWMTIIGYIKYINNERTDYKYILKVVSWGDIFYIDFDEYKQYVNPFTTIVKIGQY